MKTSRKEQIRRTVRSHYASVATAGKNCCSSLNESAVPMERTACCNATAVSSCCEQNDCMDAGPTKQKGFIYTEEDLQNMPDESFLGLGCGNPLTGAALKPGETVLDLGCGAGFDCFLAARQVGDAGRIIGVDMTPEMISKALENREKAGFINIEFRLGELENLPVADSLVDVVISNCVVNLSPDKSQVFEEAFRVLKPGGRLMIMDMLAKAPIPDQLRDNENLLCECISGAAEVKEIQLMLINAGFQCIRIDFKNRSPQLSNGSVDEQSVRQLVSAAAIKASKPHLQETR